jgi:hypothetical protein
MYVCHLSPRHALTGWIPMACCSSSVTSNFLCMYVHTYVCIHSMSHITTTRTHRVNTHGLLLFLCNFQRLFQTHFFDFLRLDLYQCMCMCVMFVRNLCEVCTHVCVRARGICEILRKVCINACVRFVKYLRTTSSGSNLCQCMRVHVIFVTIFLK